MNPIYPLLYDMLQSYLYGSLELTPHMELTLTLLSTFGCIAVIAVPFVLTWIIIKSFCEVVL